MSLKMLDLITNGNFDREADDEPMENRKCMEMPYFQRNPMTPRMGMHGDVAPLDTCRMAPFKNC